MKFTIQFVLGAAVLVLAAPAQAEHGRDVFETTCIACHAENGKGSFAGIPDLTQLKGRLAKSDEALFESIKFGMQTPGSMMAMPALGGNSSLTDEDVKDVIVYMKSNFFKD